MKYQKGFTLIELLVSMSVLVIIASVSASIFVSVMLEQKRILANQELYNQLAYALEYMSRGMRMAGKDLTGDCLDVQGRNYLLTRYSSSEGAYMGIKFINQSDNNICQEFFLDKDDADPLKPAIIKIIRGQDTPLALTSDKININFLKFIINGDVTNNIHYSIETDNIQPRITILLNANLISLPNQQINIQTTISQRDINIE